MNCRTCSHPSRAHVGECLIRTCTCRQYVGNTWLMRGRQALIAGAVVGGAVAVTVPASRQAIADWFGVEESQLPSRQQLIAAVEDVLGPEFIAQNVPAPLLPVVQSRTAVAGAAGGDAPVVRGNVPEVQPSAAPTPAVVPQPEPRVIVIREEPRDPPPDPPDTSKKKPHPQHPETPVAKGRGK